MAIYTSVVGPYFQTARTRYPIAWCSHYLTFSASQSLSFKFFFLFHNHLDWIATITITTKNLKAFDKDLLFSIIIDISRSSTYFDCFILYMARLQSLPASG